MKDLLPGHHAHISPTAFKPRFIGSQYALFVSVSNNYVAGNGLGSMGGRFDNPYLGGDFVYMNNGGNFGLLSTNVWNRFVGFDLAFVANFSEPNAQTPEPAAIFLLGGGLTGLAGFVRRRRRINSTQIDQDP